jgi:hypothetical protein
MSDKKTEKSTTSILEKKQVKVFLQERKIKEEDYSLIKKAVNIPRKERKQIAIEYHNFFSLLKDRSSDQLKRDLDQTERDEISQKEDPSILAKKEYLTVQLEIINKYNWETSWGLNVLLERLNL